MSEASENVGNFHVVSMDGRTARFLTTTGLLDTQKALAWARKNISPESGCKYAVVQITKRINVDFKPRLVEAEYEALPEETDETKRPDGTPKEVLTDADSKADLEGAPRPSKPAPQVVIGTVISETPLETATVADDAPPVEAPKPTPKAPPRPPAPPAPKRVDIPTQSPAAMAATVTAPVVPAAPKAGPSIPKPPPPPRPPVVAPRAPAPAAAPAGGGGIDDLDLS